MCVLVVEQWVRTSLSLASLVGDRGAVCRRLMDWEDGGRLERWSRLEIRILAQWGHQRDRRRFTLTAAVPLPLPLPVPVQVDEVCDGPRRGRSVLSPAESLGALMGP